MGVKITVKVNCPLFRKNVICVKVSFLTAIFFFCFCMLCFACLCVCEKSATSRKCLVSLRYQKSPLPNSSPGAFIRTAESARPSSRVVTTTPGQNPAPNDRTRVDPVIFSAFCDGVVARAFSVSQLDEGDGDVRSEPESSSSSPSISSSSTPLVVLLCPFATSAGGFFWCCSCCRR